MTLLATPFVSAWLSALALLLATGTALWLVSLKLKDAGIVDIFWGLFFVLAGFCYYSLTADTAAPADRVRRLIVLAGVTFWGLRLAGYLYRRSIGKGEDRRYQSMRRRNGARWWWFSLIQVFWLQAVIAWLVSAPLLAAMLPSSGPQPTGLSAPMGLGILLLVTGLFFEIVGDWQLRRFLRQPNSAGRVLRSGLWGLSRHPNYFGNACIWWGFGLLAADTGRWPALLSSALMTYFLLYVSGVAMLERGLLRSRSGPYELYRQQVSAFLPLGRLLRRRDEADS